VVCSQCQATQRVSKNCIECGNVFGEYFCAVCNFFDDDTSKRVFHCEGCGICRIGGRDNFFHCANCDCCYALSLRDNHKCIAGAMRQNCPVCLEDLFHSTSQVRVLRCGHTLHRKCLAQLMSRAIALHVCPLCSKTLVDHSRQWVQMDIALAQTPMPDELVNKTVTILCNDCQTKGLAPFHVLGFKCANRECGGYNTRQIMDEAANYTLLYRDANYSAMLARSVTQAAPLGPDIDQRDVVAEEGWGGGRGAVDDGVDGGGRDGEGGAPDCLHTAGHDGRKDTVDD